jgi:hypothetical protein
LEYKLVIIKIEIKKPKLLTFGTPPSNKDGNALNKKTQETNIKKSHKKILGNEIKKLHIIKKSKTKQIKKI